MAQILPASRIRDVEARPSIPCSVVSLFVLLSIPTAMPE
jgi:hypothetical protein